MTQLLLHVLLPLGIAALLFSALVFGAGFYSWLFCRWLGTAFASTINSTVVCVVDVQPVLLEREVQA